MKLSNLGWNTGSFLAATLVFVPLMALITISLENTEDIWSHLVETVLSDYITTSISLMIGVAIVTMIVGVASAYLVTHFTFPGVRWLSWGLLLPLAVPTYITAYAYTGLLDVAGPIQSQLRETFNVSFGSYWFPNIRSLGGAIFVMSFVLYPYVYMLARSAFLHQTARLEQSARLLGAGSFRVLRSVTLPIARPAIIAGVSLALMETLADYGAVSYFGLTTFTTGIFRTWYGLDSVAGAAQLSLMLLSFIIILVFFEYHSRRQKHTQFKGSGETRPQTPLNGWHKWLASVAVSLPLILGFIVPVSQLGMWAIKYHSGLFEKSFWILVWNTLSLAMMTALIALLIVLALAYATRLSNTKLTFYCQKIVSLGYAIPGTVIAIGVLIPLASLDNSIDSFARSQFNVSTGLILSGSIVALIIAYLVRFLAVSLGPVESGLGNIQSSMDMASRSLGKAPLETAYRVHLPMLRPSLLTALLLVFVDVMKELPATLILRPFNFNTLAVRAYELASDERLMEAALASITIVIVGLIPVVLLTRASTNQD